MISSLLRRLAIAGTLVLGSAPLHAQWSSLPGVNNAVMLDPQPGVQNVVLVSDGEGGAIYVWTDARAGVNNINLYAQRLDNAGTRRWGDNGRAVCDLEGNIQGLAVLGDGAGGVILVWKDERPINGAQSKHLWMQRLNADGEPQWEADGRLLRESGTISLPGTGAEEVIADGAGGFYVFTEPDPTSADTARRLHRFDASGVTVSGWPAEGVNVSVPSGLTAMTMVSDQPSSATGEHGVVLVIRSVGGGLQCRRVAADGVLGFLVNIYTFFGSYSGLDACTDGAGGVFIATGGNADMFIFRVKSDGTMAWPENNRRLVLSGGWANSGATLVPDGAGGALASWLGITSGSVHMKAQHISATGDRLWGDAGLDVRPPDNNTYAGSMIADGSGGMIVTWGVASPSQVRAQRVDTNGTKLWPDAGIVVSEPWGLTQLVSDQASGAVYSVVASGASGLTLGAKRTTLTGALGSNSPLARMINISSRAVVGSGNDVLIPGFVVTGGSVQLLVRGIGPTLESLGVGGVLSDPTLTLFNASSQQIASSDDWGASANAAQIVTTSQTVGAFALPGASADAAMLVTLPPGLYTAVLGGKNGASGVGLVELYEVGGASNAGRLANMSVRANVGIGDDILIPGIVIGGSEARTLLIRAVGPGLSIFGLGGLLADPQIALFNQGGTQLAFNDNWSSPNGAQISSFGAQVGAFGLAGSSKDAAFLITLSPGLYTAQISGVGGTTGICLVELYEVP